jgi:hypothetical protein
MPGLDSKGDQPGRVGLKVRIQATVHQSQRQANVLNNHLDQAASKHKLADPITKPSESSLHPKWASQRLPKERHQACAKQCAETLAISRPASQLADKATQVH